MWSNYSCLFYYYFHLHNNSFCTDRALNKGVCYVITLKNIFVQSFMIVGQLSWNAHQLTLCVKTMSRDRKSVLRAMDLWLISFLKEEAKLGKFRAQKVAVVSVLIWRTVWEKSLCSPLMFNCLMRCDMSAACSSVHFSVGLCVSVV